MNPPLAPSRQILILTLGILPVRHRVDPSPLQRPAPQPVLLPRPVLMCCSPLRISHHPDWAHTFDKNLAHKQDRVALRNVKAVPLVQLERSQEAALPLARLETRIMLGRLRKRISFAPLWPQIPGAVLANVSFPASP